MNVLDRFLTYVAYWTTSDDASLESPSTARQKTLGHLLVDEMQALGLQDVTMDAAGLPIWLYRGRRPPGRAGI